MRVCDFIIFEIPILTVWSAMYTYMISTVINRDLKYNKITNSHYLHLVYVGSFFRIPILLFKIYNFLIFTSFFNFFMSIAG